jgi:hypothetical protein
MTHERPSTVELVGSVFLGPGRSGDFAWMVEQPEYGDVLFVFNDNEEQFRAFLSDPTSRSGCAPGGGNAVIRPWRCTDPPRAAGIPTGMLASGGYRALTPEAKRAIDDALALIDELLATGRYRRLAYSAADASGTLGTGIFAVARDVAEYIVAGLRARVSDDRRPAEAP